MNSIERTIKKIDLGLMIVICTVIFSCDSTKIKDDYYKRETIIKLMKDVCDYQLENPTPHHNPKKNYPNGWVPASFYTGVMALFQTTGDEKYLNQALKWADQNKWKPAPRLRHADDIVCGQTYLELYIVKEHPRMMIPIKARFDSLMADPKPGRADWWWCDALFMAPPTLARLAAITQENQYLNYMHEMFWDATKFLINEEYYLYYRDERFFTQKTKNGEKVFWSRGNGWVMAGIVRILQYLPADDPYRQKYINLLRNMAKSISGLQGSDGLWRTSLLDPEEYPKPESSGSGFFCYALTWGINQGYLDKAIYTSNVKKVWQGLVEAIQPNGKLGWVQRIGSNPDVVTNEDTHAYGAGAFLLAGSEMIKFVSVN
jgi:rhamnogalacturonyl hydrolase YesR